MIRLACLLAFATTAFAATIDPTLIPADRQWVAHLDVRTLLDGKIGGYLREQAAVGEAQLRLRQFTAVTGIDVATDIDGITIAGIDDNGNHAIVWVTGRFDPVRITELTAFADQHQTTTYRGHTIHQWVDTGKNKPQAGCVVRPDLMLFGEQPTALQSALDIIEGVATGLGPNDALTKALPDQKAPFLLAAAAGGDGWKGRGARSAFVQQLTAIGLSATESGDRLVLNAQAMTIDAATATKLRDMGQGLLALAAFNDDIQKLPVLQQAVQSAQLTVTDTELTASISCDLEALRAAAEQHKAKN